MYHQNIHYYHHHIALPPAILPAQVLLSESVARYLGVGTALKTQLSNDFLHSLPALLPGGGERQAEGCREMQVLPH